MYVSTAWFIYLLIVVLLLLGFIYSGLHWILALHFSAIIGFIFVWLTLDKIVMCQEEDYILGWLLFIVPYSLLFFTSGMLIGTCCEL